MAIYGEILGLILGKLLEIDDGEKDVRDLAMLSPLIGRIVCWKIRHKKAPCKLNLTRCFFIL